AKGNKTIEAAPRYQVCSDVKCLPPVRRKVTTELDIATGAPNPPFSVPAGYELIPEAQPSAAPGPTNTSNPANTNKPTVPSGNNEPLLPFLLTAFGFGLAALFTPCVFPMIPITVSFFLNQRGGIAQALVFSLGIVVLFCLLGLGVAAAVGAFGVVQWGSNPWVNGFIAMVFAVFALSLLGAFEITLPSSLLTSLDKASRR